MTNLQSFVKWLSQPEQFSYVNAQGITNKEREKRKRELKFKYDKLSFADFSNAEIEDAGNESSSIYTPAEMKAIREETAFAEIRKHITAEDVRETTQRYIQRRNDEILRSRRVVGQKFSFRQHGYKNDN